MPAVGREALGNGARRYGGDRNNAAEGDEQRIGANWQSALCVTSVYEAMAQLEQENEALKEQLQAAKQTHDIIAAKAAETEKLREPERVSVCEQHEEEIRLLRKEKLQLENASDHHRRMLEARLREVETECRQQVTKYQEKYALDPNGAKRVALSVQTLRDTLEKVVEEKEELTIRYSQLNEMYTALQHEHVNTVKLLKDNIARLKAQRGMQRVVTVLSRWSASNVERAWRVWSTHTRIENIQKQERSSALQVQTRLQEYASRLFASQIKGMEGKFATKAVRFAFDQLNKYATRRREHRRVIESVSQSRFVEAEKRVFLSWKKVACVNSRHRDGIEKLGLVVYRHATRRGLKAWIHRCSVEQPLAQAIQENIALQKLTAELTLTLDATREELMYLREEREQYQASHSLHKQNTEELVRLKHEMELAIKEKVGRFLSKLSNRQLTANVFRWWLGAASEAKKLKYRTTQVHKMLQNRRLQRGVATWRWAVRDRKNYRAVVHRLRNFPVARCFNSWKRRVQDAKTKKTTLRVTITKMKHQITSRCFNQWKRYLQHQEEVRWYLQWIEHAAKRRQLSYGFTEWKRRIQQFQQIESQRQLQASHIRLEHFHKQQQRNLVQLQRIFYLWFQWVRDQQKKANLLKMYATRVQNAVLLRAMRSWSDFFFTRSKSKELVRRWLHRSYTSRLQSAWLKWKYQVEKHAHSTTFSELQIEHDHYVTNVHEQLAQVCMMREELLQRAEQSRSCHESSHQAVLSELIQTKRQKNRLSGAIEVLLAQQRQYALMKQVLVTWRYVIFSRKARRKQVEAYLSRQHISRMGLIFANWKQQTWKKKQTIGAVNRFIFHHGKYLLGITFDALFEHKEHQKRVKTFARTYLAKVDICCVETVFLSWRKLTRTNHLLRTAVSKVILRTAAEQVKEAFMTWSSAAKEVADTDRRERQRHILASIQARISVKWSMAVARTVFGEWKSHVSHIRLLKKAEDRLRDSYHRWLLRQCLSSWTVAIDRDAMLNGWLQRWMEKTILRKQDLAFRVWKSQVLRTQMEDLSALRQLYDEQQREVLRNREELELLRASVSISNQQLASVQATNADTKNDLMIKKRMVKLLGYFGEWKGWARNAAHQSRIVGISLRLWHRRRLAIMFACWQSFVTQRKHEVLDWYTRCKHRQLSRCFNSWQVRVDLKKNTRSTLWRLEIHRNTRIKKRVLQTWRKYVYYIRVVSERGSSLDQLLQIGIMRSALSQWRRCIEALIRFDLATKTKQRKLEFFIARFRTHLYSHVFNAWSSLAIAKKKRKALADTRYQVLCLTLKRELFRRWIRCLILERDQIQSLWRVQRISVRFMLRAATRKWARFAYASTVEAINSEKAQLIHEKDQVVLNLEASRDDAKQLRAILSIHQQNTKDAEARLAETMVITASKVSSNTTALNRSAALTRVLLHHFVRCDIAYAFRSWREKLSTIERKQTGAKVLLARWKRQLCQRGFNAWKLRVSVFHRIDLLLAQRHKRLLRASIQAWRQILNKRVMAALFLGRRLLRFLTGTHRVRDSFSLWKLTTHLTRAEVHMQQFQSNMQQSQSHLRATRQQLALSKWCWVAYSHRLSQMRLFIAKCRTIASVFRASDHRSAISILTSKHAKELQLCSETAAREIKTSLAAAAEETCVCETIVSGPSIRALQAFLRRASQAVAIHELFASVGVLGQFIHGCTGKFPRCITLKFHYTHICVGHLLWFPKQSCFSSTLAATNYGHNPTTIALFKFRCPLV